MKSCLEWRKNCRFLSEVDQFNIDFKDKKQQLLKFLDIFAITQRVNIRVPDSLTLNEIDLLIALSEQKKYNIAFCIIGKYSKDSLLFNKIKDYTTPYYFDHMIDTWDEFIGYCELNVSDIFISGQLAFDLERVASIAHEKNIKIRCYANICQSRWVGDGLKSFFIRPEDRQVYQGYIDVLQFYLDQEKPNLTRQQEILYQIYFKENKWDGDLRHIIHGLKVHLDSYYLLGREFGKRRLNCQKKCLKGKRCNLCQVLKNLADTIEESPILEVYKRREDN